jgi:hypothetical protein
VREDAAARQAAEAAACGRAQGGGLRSSSDSGLSFWGIKALCILWEAAAVALGVGSGYESIGYHLEKELILEYGKVQLLDKLIKQLHAGGHKDALGFWAVTLGYRIWSLKLFLVCGFS